MKKILIALAVLVCISISLNVYLFTMIGRIDVQIKKERLSDLFDKKIACEKMALGIKENIENHSESMFGNVLGAEIFESIFYSPKENGCLYSTEFLHNDGNREYFIFNALTKSKVTSFQFPSQFDDYKRFLLEYSNGEIRL